MKTVGEEAVEPRPPEPGERGRGEDRVGECGVFEV